VDEIRKLLELQAIDELIADLTIRLTHFRTHRIQIEKRIEEAHVDMQSTRDRFAQMQHDSRMKNLAVDELDANIRDYQTRLDEGIISFKEMEDLRAKIILERNRMDEMETEALELMDTIEATQGEVTSAEEALKGRETELREQIASLDKEASETQDQLNQATSHRSEISSTVQAFLLSQYEALHSRLENPVAEIHNGTCTGCKLRLSANTIARTRGDMGVIRCEHCSRILFSA